MTNILPDRLIKNTLDLECIGIHEFAWEYKFALNAIKFLSDNNYIILGGDVYRINDQSGKISSTGDSWYFNKASDQSDVIESYKRARDYIEKYRNRNGEYFCYSIVFDVCNA